jgi:hypothetical protein
VLPRPIVGAQLALASAGTFFLSRGRNRAILATPTQGRLCVLLRVRVSLRERHRLPRRRSEPGHDLGVALTVIVQHGFPGKPPFLLHGKFATLTVNVQQSPRYADRYMRQSAREIGQVCRRVESSDGDDTAWDEARRKADVVSLTLVDTPANDRSLRGRRSSSSARSRDDLAIQDPDLPSK